MALDDDHLFGAIRAAATPSSNDGIEAGVTAFKREERPVGAVGDYPAVHLHAGRHTRCEVDLAKVAAAFDQHGDHETTADGE